MKPKQHTQLLSLFAQKKDEAHEYDIFFEENTHSYYNITTYV